MAEAIRSRTAGLVVLTDAHLGALADDGTGPGSPLCRGSGGRSRSAAATRSSAG